MYFNCYDCRLFNNSRKYFLIVVAFVGNTEKLMKVIVIGKNLVKSTRSRKPSTRSWRLW